MSDFDFDELDKAVTSALGGQTPERTAPPTASVAGRQSSITVPSRSAPASPIMHERTMASRRVPRHTAVVDDADAAVADFSAMNDAVNSLVDNDMTDTQNGSQPEEQPETVLAEDNSNNDTVAAKPSLPSRRSGRFMDVVHPSSDMKTTAMTAMPTRQAPTLAPLESATALASEVGTDDTPDDVPQNSTPSPDDDIALKNGIEPADVPAPIDLDKPINTELSSKISDLLANGEDDKNSSTDGTELSTTSNPETTAPEPKVANENVAESATDEAASPDEGLDFEETTSGAATAPEPQTSPFLEGVTVEKRPLGDGKAEEAAQPESETVAHQSTNVEADAPVATTATGYKEDFKHPDDVTASASLPDELKSDLVSIEATDTHEVTAQAAPTGSSKKIDSITPAPQGGPTSIAKQYKEKPRTDDDDSGDIFDTKNYHKPLKDTDTKKTFSPLLLAAIVVIIVIVVAAGVFFAWWSGLLSLPF